MALFDCIVESYIPKKIIKADPKVRIKNTSKNKNIINDKKFIQAVNREYKKFPLDEELKQLVDSWGGKKSVSGVKKYMNLDAIEISDGSTGYIVEIWFNADSKNQSEEFFGGHSAIITLFLDNEYNLTKSNFDLAG